MESVSLDDDEAENGGRAPTMEGRGSPERHRGQPEVPAGPVFDISVGDPHKVGDLTSAHTVYQVRTKVRCSTMWHWSGRGVYIVGWG